MKSLTTRIILALAFVLTVAGAPSLHYSAPSAAGAIIVSRSEANSSVSFTPSWSVTATDAIVVTRSKQGRIFGHRNAALWQLRVE